MKRSFLLAAAICLSSAGFAQGPDARETSVGGAATPSAKPAQTAATDSDLDKKVCKKSIETGSLAKASRTCRTRRQWLAQSEEVRQTWEELQGSKGMTSGQ